MLTYLDQLWHSLAAWKHLLDGSWAMLELGQLLANRVQQPNIRLWSVSG